MSAALSGVSVRNKLDCRLDNRAIKKAWHLIVESPAKQRGISFRFGALTN
jgi:hypothetical protein